jgi:hypothetical protein
MESGRSPVGFYLWNKCRELLNARKFSDCTAFFSNIHKMIRERLLDFFSGNVSRRIVLSALVPLIFIFYFGTLTLAGCVFPETYDWRSSVISNLLSPRHNPEFHWLASFGLALTGLFAVPFGGYIGRRLRPASQLGANIGRAFFIGGFVALILASVIVTRRSHPIAGILGIHEILARTSALGLGIGITCFWWCAWRGSHTTSIDRKRYPRSLAFFWTILTFLAFLAVGGCVCSVLIPKTGVPGLSSLYQLLRHSTLWHLAFWEWIGSAAVFLFLMTAVLFLPKEAKS